MWLWRPRSRAYWLGAALAALGALPALAEAPARVVSLNLCTDQLALMLAKPGQVISVSALGKEPRVSAMAGAAADIPANRGLAEEVYLLAPDLVLASTFTRRSTVEMLRGLGVKVEEFAPVTQLEEVEDRLRQAGRVLDRSEAADTLAAEFAADLARLRQGTGPDAPRAALYFPNGYTSGERTLAGQILRAAGLSNVADELGLIHGGHLPLEQLVVAAPETVILGQRYPGASRSEEVLDHPVLAHLSDGGEWTRVTDRGWICGTPHVLAAVNEMVQLRERITGDAER